jgi:hypothetical protein
MSKFRGIIIFTLVLIFFAQIQVDAQDKSEGSDISELAKQSQNPVANMYQVPVSFLGDFNSGANKLFVSSLMVKPVIPITLSPKLLFIFRAIVPVTFMPKPVNKSGLSDIQLQFYLSPINKSKFIWGVGPLISLPTGIPAEMCSGKWTAGANFAGLFMLKHWVIGALVTQRWSFAGISSPDAADINQLYVNAFASYNFKHGWALGYSPEIYVNWNQVDYGWNFPLGLYVSKVFKIGKQPISASLAYYNNVVRPDNYPDMYVKAGLSFLFPKKPKQLNNQ